MVNWKLKKTEDDRVNLRAECDGEMTYSESMDTSPKRKTFGTLTAGETKTSVMRQELNSGKGGKSKWSWKDREDDMRELERKNLEQKREIQKLKKQNEAMRSDLDGIKERLAAEQNDQMSNMLESGQYLDAQGNKYIILEDDIVKLRDEELAMLRSQIEKLQVECMTYRDDLYNAEDQRRELFTKLDSTMAEKEKVDTSIQQLLKDKELNAVQKEIEMRKLKLDFETLLKGFEEKLQGKEQEGYAILNEKKELLRELNAIVEVKKQLEFEIDNMNGVIQEQVQKIDELSAKIFGRDDDLRCKLEEVEKAREECKVLQESNNIVEREQEMFFTEVFAKLDEVTKFLLDVEYMNTSEAGSSKEDRQDAINLTEGNDNINNNQGALIEELNLSNITSDSIDPGSPRSNTDVISRFEKVKNLLLHKIAEIDSVISYKDFQVNKGVNQVDEWRRDCEKIRKEAKTMKETFERLLEIKEQDNQLLREQNENMRNDCNENISALNKLQQDCLVGMENSDAYYRDHVESLASDFDKKTKNHEAGLLEITKSVESLTQEVHFLRNEIQSKERELTEMSCKYELSILQVEEREKQLREENESYLSEEIDRIQHDCKNKVKQVEVAKEANEVRLTIEYEYKVTELQMAYNMLKKNGSEVLRNEFAQHTNDAATQCDDSIEDEADYVVTSKKTNVEEELQKVQSGLTFKVREFELLQAKYEAQHRLVNFVSLSLEQERAKKNNSNEEILTILEKLEQKVNETFQCPNDFNELYASESSMNSMLTESIPDSYANSLELNTTWPQKYSLSGEASPIRQCSSLDVLEQDQGKQKEFIERLRSEISSQLNGMSSYLSTKLLANISPTQTSLFASKLPKPWSNIMDDDIDHLSPIDHNMGLPNKYGKLSSSSPSIRETFAKSKVSHDSGLDQNDDINELISFPNQLHNVIEMFRKLEEQHKQMKEDNSIAIDKQWSNDLENWKNRVQYKLNDLKPKAPSERSDSALSTISGSSILFHPNDNEVKAIIENANKMYDNAHFVL